MVHASVWSLTWAGFFWTTCCGCKRTEGIYLESDTSAVIAQFCILNGRTIIRIGNVQWILIQLVHTVFLSFLKHRCKPSALIYLFFFQHFHSSSRPSCNLQVTTRKRKKKQNRFQWLKSKSQTWPQLEALQNGMNVILKPEPCFPRGSVPHRGICQAISTTEIKSYVVQVSPSLDLARTCRDELRLYIHLSWWCVKCTHMGMLMSVR